MLAKPAIYLGRQRDKLDSRILKGIPDSVRCNAWRTLIDPDWKSPKDRDPIAKIIALNENSPFLQQIRLDVSRTMPQVPLFSTPELQQALRELLHAYANVDTELGYTQSMAFIAATLLLYMDVDSAFWCFRALMLDRRYNFRGFYTDGFPKLFELKKVWDQLLNAKHPDFVRFLENNSILFENYAMSWFMCAFMDVDFVPVLRLRIFDRYAGFGTRALLSFGLTLIGRLKHSLMTGSPDLLVPTLRQSGNTPEMRDWRGVIRDWDKAWLSEKEYRNAFKRARVALFP
jgi:hypothetical protein